jgi:hypothetical protein
LQGERKWKGGCKKSEIFEREKANFRLGKMHRWVRIVFEDDAICPLPPPLPWDMF